VTGPLCPSMAHKTPTPGTVTGRFTTPRHNLPVAYCADCARMLTAGGYFTPDPVFAAGGNPPDGPTGRSNISST
jgi:hypothetical protein